MCRAEEVPSSSRKPVIFFQALLGRRVFDLPIRVRSARCPLHGVDDFVLVQQERGNVGKVVGVMFQRGSGVDFRYYSQREQFCDASADLIKGTAVE